MAKPPPGDNTQPLSQSQVLAVTPKPPRPGAGKGKGIVPGDQSIAWKGTVVSADEFALPKAPRGGGKAKWVVAGVLGVGAVGAGTYEMWPAGKGKTVAAVGSGAGTGSGSATAAGTGTGSAAGTGTGTGTGTGSAAGTGTGSGSGSSSAVGAVMDAGVPDAVQKPDAISGAQQAAAKPKIKRPVRKVSKKRVTKRRR